jgi:endo-1,3-1,4-beta-glycanase ExoK
MAHGFRSPSQRGGEHPHRRSHNWLGIVLLLMCSPVLNTAGRAEDRVAVGSSFVERFSEFDATRWYVADGWSNGPYQNCTWSGGNVRFEKEAMELLLTRDPTPERSYRCAELQTRQFFGYGTYEVRMRSAATGGVVTAFFTYTGPPHGGRPHDEIDFEFLGKDRGSVQLNYYVDGVGQHEHYAALGFDGSQAVNDYAFEWLPHALRWFINGRLVHEVTAGPGKALPSRPGKIYLSIWNGADAHTSAWLGTFEFPGTPLVARYELVAFTAAGGPCQFPTSIVCMRGAAATSLQEGSGQR